MERFFRVVSNINQLLFLLVLLGAALLMVWGAFESNNWRTRNAVPLAETGAEKAPVVSFRFSTLKAINGTNVQLMELKTESGHARLSSGSSYEDQTRNLLFLSGDEKNPHWLFNDHKNLIVETEQLTEKTYKDESRQTRAIYIEFIDTDTNNDRLFSIDDKRNVALIKPDGQGMLVVLQNVDKVFSNNLPDAEHLSVIYQRDGQVKHASFSLADFSLLQNQDIVSVPERLE